MAQTRYKQDMPPPGGYAKISIERILPRSYFKSPYMIGGSLLATLIMYKEYLKNRDRLRLWNLETNDVFVSLQPFLVAERDRAYLKHIRKNYEEEKLIMKDVPEWEVGTFYGEKIYKTAPPDYHMNEGIDQLYVHCSPYDLNYQWNYGNMTYHIPVEYKYKPKENIKIN